MLVLAQADVVALQVLQPVVDAARGRQADPQRQAVD